MKQIEDEKLFARTLKKVLSEHNFYDIHEFLLHKFWPTKSLPFVRTGDFQDIWKNYII